MEAERIEADYFLAKYLQRKEIFQLKIDNQVKIEKEERENPPIIVKEIKRRTKEVHEELQRLEPVQKEYNKSDPVYRWATWQSDPDHTEEIIKLKREYGELSRRLQDEEKN